MSDILDRLPSTTPDKARQKKPEHSFQAWLNMLLDKIVLYPREIRGHEVASAAMANIWTSQMMLGRGVKPGFFDHTVVQGNPLVMVGFEVKAGVGKSRASQEGTATAYERCGVTVCRECRTMAQAVAALRTAGVRLHGNTDNLVVEYQARADAALREIMAAKGAAPKKKAAARPRTKRPTAADVRRGNAFTARRLGI